MEIEKLLRDLRLNKYETNAYLIILKKGILKASTISKEGAIPFGKVYESLSSLLGKGLIEVQNTRPKKYKIRKPHIAFKDFIEAKKEESEKDLEKLKNSIRHLEEKISKINTEEVDEKIFWMTAIGEDIEELVRSAFLEAKKEIYLLPYTINKKDHEKHSSENILFFLKEIVKSTSRGIKIKAIFSKEFSENKIKIFKNLKVDKKIIKHIEIKIQKDIFSSPFIIIDSEKVILRVDDPINQDKILAMIKISDSMLAKKLKNKFNTMWESSTNIKIK